MRISRLMRSTMSWLLLLLLAGFSVGAQSPTNPPVRFRVMSYNIHHGEGIDGRIDLARIAAVIQQAHADLVALQEVDKGVARTQRRDFPAELAVLTGMTCVFSNNLFYQGGEYGNALLSRFPVLHWTNTHYRMIRPGEQRGVLQAQVKIGAHQLIFMSTHLDYHRDNAERQLNVAQLQQILPLYCQWPVILAGDFNDTPDSQTYAEMQKACADVWTLAGEDDGFTITSQKPHKRIDYVWLKPHSDLRPVKAWVPRSLASDHLPVVVEFIFP